MKFLNNVHYKAWKPTYIFFSDHLIPVTWLFVV